MTHVLLTLFFALAPQTSQVIDGYTIITLGPARDASGASADREACDVFFNAVFQKDDESVHGKIHTQCVGSQKRYVLLIEQKTNPPPSNLPFSTSAPASTPASKANATSPKVEVFTTSAAPTEKVQKKPANPSQEPTTTNPSQIPSTKKPLQSQVPPKSTATTKMNEAKQPFIKGELTDFGSTRLLTKRNSFVVGFGLTNIESKSFLSVRPELQLKFDKFSFAIGAPLRFQILELANLTSGGDLFEGAGAFRNEDWDQIEDFLRPLRFVTYGKKEDNLYIDLNRVHHLTLGHGQLMRRYSPTVDIDEDNLFAEVDAYGDAGGVELIAGPFPVPRVIGGLFFLKPLGLFSENVTAKSFSVGFSYVADLNTPDRVITAQNIADQRTQIAVLDDGDLLTEKRGAFVGDVVQGLGIDAELKVLKTQNVDVKLYADASGLVFPETDSLAAFTDMGFTGGALFRMAFGSKPNKRNDERGAFVPQHAFRIRAEARTFGPQFLPSYFDELYEVDKLQFGFGNEPLRAELPTKWQHLSAQQNGAWRTGGYLEATWLVPNLIAFSLLYEDAFDTEGNPVPAARNFAIHAESSNVEAIQVFATYHYRHFEDVSKIFQFSTDNEVLYFGGRLRVLPFLFVNAAAQRAFRVGFSPDDLPGQKTALPNDESGDTFRFSSTGAQNIWAGTLEIELGWAW